MHSQPEKNLQATRSTPGHKRFVGDEVFDEPLRSVDDVLLSQQKRKAITNPAKENRHHDTPLNPTPPEITQSKSEPALGSPKNPARKHAMSQDNAATDLFQRHVNRWIPWFMQFSSSSISNGKPASASSYGGKRINQAAKRYKDPWRINSLWDLWKFFGPAMTILIALQALYSLKFAELFRKFQIPAEHASFNWTALIMMLVSYFISFLVLKGCMGQNYKNFIPRLVGIGFVSAMITLLSFLLPEFL
jgi:hypothetical protein